MTAGELESTGPTTEDLREDLLRRRLAGSVRTAASGIAPVDRGTPLRLSDGQRQMWFLSRLHPESTEYLIPQVLQLRGALDTDAFGRAWDELIARHEILRTRYVLLGDEPTQLIDPPRSGNLMIVDSTAVPPNERADLALVQAQAAVATPFDLEHQHPLRAALHQVGQDEHLLVVVLHHIASDERSLEVMMTELAQIYEAFVNGVPSPLPAPALQYADYAGWQRSWPDPAGREAQLTYWRQRLADLTPLALPLDRPRPIKRDAAGAALNFDVPASVVEGLRVIADRHRVTLFTVLLAAFQAQLAVYTGSRDIAVGTVVSGRTRPELHDLVGYGINTLVLRTTWTADPSFDELVDRNRATVLEAIDRQDIPFAQLVDLLQPERDLAMTPLFQVAFTMHDEQAGWLDLGPVRAEPVSLGWQVAKFDLNLQVSELTDGGINCQFSYATALFDDTTIQRYADHLGSLLASAAEHPERPLSRLDMIGPAELATLLPEVADEVTNGLCLHEIFQQQVARAPGAVAVVCDGVALSYGELNVRANRVAHLLRSMGVGPESLVGVCLERSLDLVVTLLAVLKAGGAYVPLDPAYPADRLSFMAADSALLCVVTENRHAELVDSVFSGPTLVLEQARAEISQLPTTDPESRSVPDNAVYVIYTSGSTGRPKGVQLTHRNVTGLFTSAQDWYSFSADDAWSMFHSYAFDVSVWELWGALLHGGRLVVVPFSVARSPEDFLDLLVDEGVTILSQTPSAFRSLVTLAAEGDPLIGELNLRAVVFGGEKLELADLTPWVEALGSAHPALINMYGITETTVHTTFRALLAGDWATPTVSPVGIPLPDLGVQLLDADLDLVPIGVVGEIHVTGRGLARGYLNRPSLTAERFVPDPYGPPGTRRYRSGDLARRLPDGSLESVGRADDQVKIRGYRVELGEIQAALATHPGIRECVVVVAEEVPGQRELVAYYVPTGGSRIATSELSGLLGQTLPVYMVPSAFVALDAIPLTNNGKTDKRALPSARQVGLPGADTEPAAGAEAESEDRPRTAIELRIAQVWQTVLRRNSLGFDETFFDLGGDSIRAVSLVGALREAGFDLSVQDIFEHRTVADLAGHLTDQPAPAPADAAVAPFALIGAADRQALPDGVVDAYPLSQVQLGMVAELLSDGTQNTYHNITMFHVADEHPFDSDALRAAVAIVVARHEVLRTSIAVTGYAVPMQLVHAAVGSPCAVHDLRGADPAERERQLRKFAAQERALPFDLSAAPLLRVTAHVTDDGWWLSLTECHPILEGWSFHSLLMELLGLFRELRSGVEPADYEVPAVRYVDFVAAEQAAIDSPQDREFWRRTVSELPPFELPDNLGDSLDTPREFYRTLVPYHDLEPALRVLAVRARASLKNVLLAAHLTVLGMFSHEPTFHTGLVCDGRPEAVDADRVYGMYLNTVPFPARRQGRTWREVVRQVLADEIELWPHRRFPMPVIQRDFGVGARLVDVMFNYQNFHQVDLAQIHADDVIDEGHTEFGLAVTTLGGSFALSSNTHEISRANADRLAFLYRAVIESMAADPDGEAVVTVLPPGELDLLLADATPDVVSDGRCLQDLFQAQVLRAPNAVAAVCDGVALSYGDLNLRANRLAHLLQSMDIGPESLVGVCLERSLDLVVTLLAVLKAGGAYVPLDPAYPADRLSFMAADSGLACVVTEDLHAELADSVFGGPVLVLEQVRSQLAQQPGTDPELRTTADNAAYVIYTSGSTGRPKGVQLTHRNVTGLFAATAGWFDFGPDDAWSMFHSYAFDFSVWELWGALLHGGRLVVVPFSVARSPEDFLDLLVDEGVTMLSQTPSAFRSLTALAADGHPLIADLNLRAVVFGGEKLELADLTPWVAALGSTNPTLINMYGITETTVHTTYRLLQPADWTTPSVSPVGIPLPDLGVQLLDRDLNLVPIGAVGEIHVTGRGLARGYLNRPALTAERFVPDPYGAPGSRRYRSGDLARRLPGGELSFTGRSDDQVKIRGYRIELGEIQAALGASPTVRECVVIVREDIPGHRELVAYYVRAAGAQPTPTSLRAELAETLAPYMVPAAFVELRAIPLTSTSKLDRAALPAPEEDALPGVAVGVKPRSALEAQVAAIWSDVLGVPEVSVHDQFFELGGDSIRVLALVGAMRAVGLDVSVRSIYQDATVAGVTAALNLAPAEVAEFVAVQPFEQLSDADRALLPADAVDAYPFGQIQLGMLVEMYADAERRPYHNATCFRVTDDRPFDEGALRAAVGLLVQRHEILRTSFDLTTFSQPLQVVHLSAQATVQCSTLPAGDLDGERAVLRQFIGEQRRDLFAPEEYPLVRVYAHVSDGGWWLTITESHVILEGWSHNALVNELIGCYRAFRDRRQAPASGLAAVRFADFIAAERATLDAPAHRDYWHDIVSSHPPVRLPASWADAPTAPSESFQVLVDLGDLTADLTAAAAATRSSTKTVLLAAHLSVLGALTSESAFTTGLISHGRLEAAGAEQVYGMHLNTVPFAADRSAASWRELIGQVLDREAELWPHRRYPLPAIQRDAGATGLITSTFSYLDFHAVDELVDGTVGLGETPNEMGLNVIASGQSLLLSAENHTINRQRATELSRRYLGALRALTADLDAPVWQPGGPAEPVAEAVSAGTAGTALAMFERQVAATPVAIAVRSAVGRMSFTALDKRANQIARRLIGAGVRSEDRVAVLLDRGPDLIASLLAVWKAGAAYVPLDPTFPAARIAAIVADSRPRTVITHSTLTSLIEGTDDLLVLDDEQADIAALPTSTPGLTRHPANLASIIYTSGTTGVPKGVGVTQGGLANYLTWTSETYAVRGTGGAPLFSSIAFDMVVTAIFTPLVSGQPVHLLPADLSVADLGRQLSDSGPYSFVKLTPGHLELLLQQLDADELAGLAGIFVVGGERFAGQLLSNWQDKVGSIDVPFVNEYGPTEITVANAAYSTTTPHPGAVPIGVSIAGTTMYLLEDDLTAVATGATGGIYVGGAGVTRGYAGRPGLTADCFRPDPFGAPGSRMYRTGDLGRELADGVIDCLGRLDDQVKIRGYRVEPAEVEVALTNLDEVSQAVVVARADTAGSLTLIGYVVAAAGAQIEPEAIRAALATRVPDYLVPSAIIALLSIPLNANGKVDRTALPAAVAAPEVAESDRPTSPLEHEIAGLFTELLGVEEIGVHDSFLEHGGHSLLVIRLIGRIRNALSADLPIDKFFANPTVAGIAARLTAAGSPAPEAVPTPSRPKLRRMTESEPEA